MFGLGTDDTGQLLFLVTLLALLVGSALFGWGWRGTHPARRHIGHLLTWALIAVALVTLYAYRAPLQRFAAPVLQELDPSRAVEVTTADGIQGLSIARGRDGHFHIDASANGTPVSFLVDTGASTSVLTLRDAERAGIEIAGLEFTRPVQTANGLAFFAQTNLRTLEIGPYKLNSVPVGIMPEGALETSLLGMSTIDRFAGWRIDGNRMVLLP
jgi:aspartyl protease family protein